MKIHRKSPAIFSMQQPPGKCEEPNQKNIISLESRQGKIRPRNFEFVCGFERRFVQTAGIPPDPLRCPLRCLLPCPGPLWKLRVALESAREGAFPVVLFPSLTSPSARSRSRPGAPRFWRAPPRAFLGAILGLPHFRPVSQARKFPILEIRDPKHPPKINPPASQVDGFNWLQGGGALERGSTCPAFAKATSSKDTSQTPSSKSLFKTPSLLKTLLRTFSEAVSRTF